MDPALLREREAFKKRAMATPTVEKKSRPEATVKDVPKPKVRPPSAAPKLDASNYKTMAGSSQYRFGVLAKIVKHMRNRHLEGEDHMLTLDDILDETNQLDVGSSVKNWLQTEALQENPKIDVSLDKLRFAFKPVFKLKDGKSLIKLLKQYDLKGLGGIMLEEIQESLPHCEKVLKNYAKFILYITRPTDKKKIVFYNDKSADITVDEEFKKLWRSIPVDSMEDAKIAEYLEKQGIRSMQDHGPKKPLVPKRKKAQSKKRQFKKPRDNEHLADVLVTYEDNTITQEGAKIKQS
ncbi:general transcription factor IIE subunit 2 [Sitodiplosis mosellana]|uniref:general transcription factor IIE subunit 2 n=1 Tax=Sitodiplosis mosellana TaxID=263140 RepID=UPI00244445D6|nr:general transcription factor IIE subunit 2 [Sitodiplosis mosellana]